MQQLPPFNTKDANQIDQSVIGMNKLMGRVPLQ